MKAKHGLYISVLSAVLAACAAEGGFDSAKAVAVGATALQAAMLDEATVASAARAYATELDGKSQLAAPNSSYATRLVKITSGLQNYSGLKLDFRVYLAQDINAFAMADGTVRVYSGLMDLMPDDQVLAVVAHEIGHVKLKHSYRQMREQLLTSSAFQAVAGVGGTIGQLTSSELGALAFQAITARFSQADELEADSFSVKALHALGKDPGAMLRAMQLLQSKTGNGGGFLSSHPSNSRRIENIQKTISQL